MNKRQSFAWSAALLFLSLAACKKPTGCTDSSALNFNPDAKEDDNACFYDVDASAQVARVQDAGSDLMGLLAEDLQMLAFGIYELNNNADMRSNSPLPNCASVSIDSTPGLGMYPAVLHIDFGTSGCYCEDGKVRKGRLDYYINNSWRTEAGYDTVRITPVSYFVSNQEITGIRTYTKKNSFTVGNNAEMPMDFWVDYATRVAPSGTHNYDYHGFLVWGVDTADTYRDDLVRMTIHEGMYYTPTASRFAFIAKHENPLIADAACLDSCFFNQGEAIIELTYTETATAGGYSGDIGVINTGVLDFGDGSCENAIELRLVGQGRRLDNQSLIYADSTVVGLRCTEYILVD